MYRWIVILALVAYQPVTKAGQAGYHKSKVQRQKGPGLGRYSFQQLLQTALDELERTRDPDSGEKPAVVQVEAVRGPVLMVAGGEVWPGPRVVALLVVTENRYMDTLARDVDLFLVGLKSGLPRVLRHLEVDSIDVVPGMVSWQVKLSGWRIHPEALALGVTTRYTEYSGTETWAGKTIRLYAADTDGGLFDLLQNSPHFDCESEKSGDLRIDRDTKLRIDRFHKSGGLFRLTSEHREDEFEAGILRRREILYYWHCFGEDAYESCPPKRS